jgi:hypothetical protein
MELEQEYIDFLIPREYFFRTNFDAPSYQLSKHFGLKRSLSRHICQAYYEQFIEKKQVESKEKTEDELEGVMLNLFGIERQMVEVRPLRVEPIPKSTKVVVTYPSRASLNEEE